MDFTGKTAISTGAASGMGLLFSQNFAELGGNVVMCDVNEEVLNKCVEEINAKTGWYPKLVFCNLILLGEDTAKQNVFDALDYFLLDEYLSDNCLVAACNGKAKDILMN